MLIFLSIRSMTTRRVIKHMRGSVIQHIIRVNPRAGGIVEGGDLDMLSTLIFVSMRIVM